MSEKFRLCWTSQFKKDYKKMMRQGRDIKRLDDALHALSMGEALPVAFRDHLLSGKWSQHHECHIAPDWLLIYQVHENVLVLELTRTGTHSELFS